MEKGIDYPNWLTEEALDTLSKGYLREGETPNLMYLRLAKAAAEHYKSCYDELGLTYLRELQVAFYNMLFWGWLSPSSPVASNFGTSKYLPVSCYLQSVSNSIDGIFSTAHEAAMLSKNGGGLGIDVTNLVGKSCVSNWARLYDTTASIVSQGNCYDPLTEILTSTGWKFFGELTEADKVAQITDNRTIEFVFPIEIVEEYYEGELIHFTNRKGQVDLLVTPNHGMIIERRKRVTNKRDCFGKFLSHEKKFTGVLEKVESSKLACHRDVYMYDTFPAQERGWGLDDSSRLRIAFQADGHLLRDRKNYCTFHFAKKRKRDRLVGFLENLGIHYAENYRSADKTWTIGFKHKDLQKDFNWIDLSNISAKWAKEFIQEVGNWDGSFRKGAIQYTNTSLEAVEKVQAVACLAGYKTSFANHGRKKIHHKDIYSVYCCLEANNRVGLESVSKKLVPYSGPVHCVEVPSGRILVRRNGVVKVCGNTRRGAVAIYCDIDHRDIDAFLHSKELSIGDARDKIYSNIAVIVTDDFMNRLINGDPVAKERFSKVLRLRMKTGSPYIMFIDNANRHRCEAYVNNDLYISQSNLCIEIFQHTNKDHTANCVLSSLNAAKFDEWSGHRMTRAQYTIPELAIFFLDAVQQEFIDKTYNHVEGEPYPGFERSRRAAVKGRALGLGIVGLHSLYQKRGFPFDSKDAQGLNRCLFSRVLLDAERATKVLGKVKGVPEWCRGTGRRNSLLLAVAPTTTNSILCNAGSPGIEPCYSNYFVQMGAKGNYIRRNQHLVKVLEKYGKNTEEVWEIIRRDDGSVQGLDFLSKKEKEVFKTFSEISPDAILEQAADRQAFIDQGQSLNLYIPSDASAMEIWRLHLKAWKLGLKGLYYVRSNSEVKRALQNEKMITVHLKTRDGCIYCESAKSLLDDMLIPYTEEEQLTGTVPIVFINGEPLEGGYTGLCEYFGVTLDEEACSGCEG